MREKEILKESEIEISTERENLEREIFREKDKEMFRVREIN